MGKVLIEVTADDIEAGIPKSPTRCAVAASLRRAGFIAPLVDDESICVGGWPDRDTINPPESVVRFIRAFDKGKPVKPFRFFLKTEWATTSVQEGGAQ